MKKFLLGSDPEAFIVNNRSGLVVSAKRFTVGTKDEPENCENGYALLNDNILIEGNVPPAATKEEFIVNMSKLWSMMNERASTRGAHIENDDCREISDALMDTNEAKEFGCSSFRDAWNELVEIETPRLSGNQRPAGCHIHIGLDDASDSLKMAVVRAFDMFVTIPSITMTGQNYRTANLYGLLGACRVKSYGVEARSLGGTFFNPKYFAWIYENVEKAINFAYENEDQLVNLPGVRTLVGSQRLEIISRYKSISIKK